MNILIINGPNLNMLGKREKHLYGDMGLDEIQKYTEEKCRSLNVSLQWFQSNEEAKLIEKIHRLAESEDFQGLIINPGGLSHTSVVLLDALSILSIPIAEVHLSQIYKREDFRKNLLTARAATIMLTGIGKDCYHVAVYSLINMNVRE